MRNAAATRPIPVLTPTERAEFWSQVSETDHPYGCWMLPRPSYHLRYRENHIGYRIAYTLSKGEIPSGHEVDHLCYNNPCVRPEHLDAVTPSENTRRAGAVRVHRRQHLQEAFAEHLRGVMSHVEDSPWVSIRRNGLFAPVEFCRGLVAAVPSLFMVDNNVLHTRALVIEELIKFKGAASGVPRHDERLTVPDETPFADAVREVLPDTRRVTDPSSELAALVTPGANFWEAHVSMADRSYQWVMTTPAGRTAEAAVRRAETLIMEKDYLGGYSFADFGHIYISGLVSAA